MFWGRKAFSNHVTTTFVNINRESTQNGCLAAPALYKPTCINHVRFPFPVFFAWHLSPREPYWVLLRILKQTIPPKLIFPLINNHVLFTNTIWLPVSQRIWITPLKYLGIAGSVVGQQNLPAQHEYYCYHHREFTVAISHLSLKIH